MRAARSAEVARVCAPCEIGSVRFTGPWVDGVPVVLSIAPDPAGRRRKILYEDGKPWASRVARKSLCAWFNEFMRARQV